jgi:CheY-like chemotaxis protein
VSYLLLAEDDPHIRAALGELLRDEGYAVLEAVDGPATLAEARANPPALLLLDLMLPVVDGWQILRERQRDPTLRAVPVLVVSAARREDLDRALALGADAALRKPFEFEDLLEQVARLVGERQSGPSAAGQEF